MVVLLIILKLTILKVNTIKKILREESISLATKVLITELRDGVFRLIKSKTEQLDDKPWPDYVVKDMLYGTLKNMPINEIEEFIESMVHEYPNRKWELDNIDIDINVFDEETQKQLIKRKPKEGVSANPNRVPRDKERHEKQRELIKKNGPSKEPIIIVETSDGNYSLLEGWHRTIQTLDAYPNGYKQNAWIYRY